MKNKKSFLGKVFGFFDKFIIVPVTRFTVKISSFFDNSNKSLENFLSRSNTLLFVSMILAISLFIVIDQKIMTFSNKTAEVLKDQPVEAVYNEEAYVVEGLPDSVDITLMGSRSDLFIAKQSSTSKVTVDLTGLKPGTHKVNIEYTQPINSIDYNVNPSVATVNIYQKISETKTLTTDILNQDSLDSKLVINSVTPSSSKVVVKGTDDKNAVNSLTKVASVKALLDVSSLSVQDKGVVTLKDVPLKAYDKDGNILNVEIVPSKVSVDVDLSSPSKEVPIKVIPTGNIGFGKAIESISTSESKVTVYGKQSDLDKLQYVPVNVDVDGLKEDRDYKLEITKPSGVKSMSVNNITVSLKLGSATDKNIDNVNIDVRNLNDKYSVQGLSASDIKVTVTVKGVDSVLKQLTAEDITAYIDLKDYKTGEYEVPVSVEGSDARVQYVSKTKKVQIKVVEK